MSVPIEYTYQIICDQKGQKKSIRIQRLSPVDSGHYRQFQLLPALVDEILTLYKEEYNITEPTFVMTEERNKTYDVYVIVQPLYDFIAVQVIPQG